jgi:uncharacterized protein
MLVKIHKTGERKIISLCDDNLVGEKVEDEDLQLDISEYFYKGKKMKEIEILEELKSAHSLNVVGKESVRFALKHNLITEQNIVKIKNIPHAISILK